ncbi:Probable terpene synthase 3 [Linum perenne]
MWPLGGFIKPGYTAGRIFVTKITALISALDDIFDVHGTIDELELVAQVIERWETRDEDKLPSYFKHWFNAMLDVFAEIEAHVSKQGRSFCMYYAREGVKQIARAFIKEARWYNNNYVATVEEHLQNGYMSIGYPSAITVIYCGMGEVASEEVFEWLFSQPKISVAGSTIARLVDDILSHEFEQERGHVASTVECYMKQYGVSKEEAHMELNKLVEKLWKDMNEDMLRPLKATIPVLLTILNKVRTKMQTVTNPRFANLPGVQTLILVLAVVGYALTLLGIYDDTVRSFRKIGKDPAEAVNFTKYFYVKYIVHMVTLFSYFINL